jgi:hypothetical protein
MLGRLFDWGRAGLATCYMLRVQPAQQKCQSVPQSGISAEQNDNEVSPTHTRLHSSEFTDTHTHIHPHSQTHTHTYVLLSLWEPTIYFHS